MTVKVNLSLLPALMLASAILGCACLFGCGSGGAVQDTAAGSLAEGFNGEISWPPAPAHHVLAANVLNGAQYASKNPASQVSGTQLQLNPSNGYGWAIYTLSGFPVQEVLESISVDTTIPETDDNLVLFVGLSHYSSGAWEWHATSGGDCFIAPEAGDEYISPAHQTSVAVVYCGSENALANTITITTADSNLAAPANLTASSNVGQVDLSWDECPDADGYFIERSEAKEFAEPLRLNTELHTSSDYSDTASLTNKVYYYRVIALYGPTESAPSAYVDIHVPTTDLPAPQNVRVDSAGITSVTLAWDWEGAAPSTFQVFVDNEPDAPLGSPDDYVLGFMHSITLNGLATGQTIYVRVAAMNSSNRLGRASDDIPASVQQSWQWDTPQVIGTGSGPIVVCQSPTAVTAAYKSTTGIDVASSNNGSVWIVEPAISNTSASSYIDIDYSSSGKYCLVSFISGVADLGGVIGAPGEGWTYARIHGDGSGGEHRPSSGISCDVTASDTEFCVVHYSDTDSRWYVQTTPATGHSWDTNVLLDGVGESTCSVTSVDGEFHAAYYNQTDSQLQLADRTGNWLFSAALVPANNGIGWGARISNQQGNWYSPAMNMAQQKAYVLSGSDTPWEAEYIGSLNQVGNQCTPIIATTELTAFCGLTLGLGWHFIDYRGSWVVQNITVPTASVGSSLGFTVVDGVPWIIFADSGDGMIKCSKGIPPA